MTDCQSAFLLVVLKIWSYLIVTARLLALQEVFQLMMFQLLDGVPEVCENQNTLLRACATELVNM